MCDLGFTQLHYFSYQDFLSAYYYCFDRDFETWGNFCNRMFSLYMNQQPLFAWHEYQ